MIFIFIFFIFTIINSIYCSNFRSIPENSQSPDTNGADSLNEMVLSIPYTKDSNDTGFLTENMVTRQMDDMLIQEKPVLLNTIPHTALNHVLFVNSSGLFTNITVVLTTTVPIAIISPENDSIHRILSGSTSNETLESLKTDFEKINTQISENINTLPMEILKIVESTAERFKESSLILTETSLEDMSSTNSTLIVS